MHSRSVGFVGGGRITSIFLEALGGRGLALERVTVSDTSPEVLSGLKARFPAVTTTADNAAPAACERVFLALHPPVLRPSSRRSHPDCGRTRSWCPSPRS